MRGARRHSLKGQDDMPKVRFKAKVQRVLNMDGTLAYEYVKVPALGRRHADMHAFRTHPRFGPLANSDMFPSVLARAAKAIAPQGIIRLDDVPAGATVDTTGYLATVTLEL